MSFSIQIQQAFAQPLAVVRRRATAQELSQVVPAACGVVWNAIRSQNITGAGRHVAVYLDNVFNLEIGVELDAPFAGHGEVIGSATPAGTVATTTHFGPYNLLGQAHDAVQAWCRDNGHTLAGPCWEVFDHWQDAWNNDPSQIRTDVYYLLL